MAHKSESMSSAQWSQWELRALIDDSLRAYIAYIDNPAPCQGNIGDPAREITNW